MQAHARAPRAVRRRPGTPRPSLPKKRVVSGIYLQALVPGKASNLGYSKLKTNDNYMP